MTFTARSRGAGRASLVREPASQPTNQSPGPLPDYAALVEAAGDFIYTLDLEGRFTYLNRAAGRLLGRPVEELLGKKFTAVLTPLSCEIALRHFGRGLAGTEATPFFEVELLRSDGSTVLIEVRAGSLHRDGKLVGRQGIGRDISALRSLQEAIAVKSERVALLEERTRIAMSLYARIAELTGEDTQDAGTSSQALRQLHDTVLRVTADKHGLTAFDVSVLRLLAQGGSNREIAAALHRSPHTIKDHIKKIKARVGATRRAELVTTALKLGLVTQDR
ncbi:PAS domain S-box protein [Steroidobacter flavus]|uniref:PAS domain S-box protein n=1 Tax=Steroidobacter flavus TaxID=1842136 RepID=A0ABV8T724_9GAMM